tara:strand:+ start:307 stop:1551 length:1245 start_codon:yes stop_codon:yes gene_type:complete
MGDGYGSPIRLHFEDPDVMSEAGYEDGMELQALSIALSVERKVGGMSLPYFGGRRLGIDMNRSASTIIIDGIFTDDDLSRRGISAKSASAVIDFGYIMSAGRTSVGKIPDILGGDIDKLTNGTGQSKGGFLNLKSQDGNTYQIRLQKLTSGSVGFVSGSGNLSIVTVRIDSGGSLTTITPAQLATAVASAIGAFSGSPFTTTISASDAPNGGNAKIIISQSNAGKMTAEGSVSFENNANMETYHELFRGGRNASNTGGKSAGDKVQDLYGILHNTGRGGFNGLATGIRLIAGAVSQTIGAIATGGTSLLDSFTSDRTSPIFGDYPIGIQIPYNSMITAPDGKKYAARNFFVPTGNLGVDDKMSHTNDNPAGIKFNEDDRLTGIKGAVQKFDVAFSAAEEHYTYQMVFVPIDFLG